MLPKGFYISIIKNCTMRQYIILLLLIILLTSCAPKVDVDTAKPVEELREEPKEAIEKWEEAIEEEPGVEEVSLEENTIEIKENIIDPERKVIERNTEITWVNKDKKEHKIACYLGGTRVTTSSNLKQEDSFVYTFLKEGDYTCIDAIYGLRSTIIVEGQKALLSPTGRAVIGEGEISRASFAAIALIAIIVLLFFVFGRKR